MKSPDRKKYHTGLQIIFLVFATLSNPLALAQRNIIPAKKAYSWNPPEIFKDLDAACTDGVKGDIEVHNYSTKDIIACSPTANMIQEQTSTAVYVGSKASEQNPNAFACLVKFTSTLTLSGEPEACGSSPGTWTGGSIAERRTVVEVRICEQSDGWQQFDQNTCHKPSESYPYSKHTPKCGNPTSLGSGCKQESIPIISLPSGSKYVPIELRYGN
ncbi:hypothetical protein [Acidovorax sp. FG27]|uniref:hypothetical protein n=1 Tax=Acidovorax sp. FG27 TaxID=3133652 RepID=UPI0030EA6B4F